MSLLIELTKNQVKMQLIPSSDIREDLQNMKQEIADTIEWIHIGAIQLVVKSALFQGVDS